MPSRLGTEANIWVNGERRHDIRVLSVERSFGGGRLDHAVIDQDLGLTDDVLIDRQLRDEWKSGPQLVEVTVEQGGKERLIHWATDFQLGSGDSLTNRS